MASSPTTEDEPPHKTGVNGSSLTAERTSSVVTRQPGISNFPDGRIAVGGAAWSLAVRVAQAGIFRISPCIGLIRP